MFLSSLGCLGFRFSLRCELLPFPIEDVLIGVIAFHLGFKVGGGEDVVFVPLDSFNAFDDEFLASTFVQSCLMMLRN